MATKDHNKFQFILYQFNLNYQEIKEAQDRDTETTKTTKFHPHSHKLYP